jgi:Family of unknown function (DUF5677)
MDFHFGATPESDLFFSRNPKFYPAFERLMALANKCFGRTFYPKNRSEDICFSLGETCREDFLEILFLAVHGYGYGACKLLRGLYERAVALAYMVKRPEKAERFVRYAAIQEYKAMVAALKLVSEEEFDKAMAPKTSAAQIREFREMVKPEFQVEVCKECHRTDTAFSWDKRDVLAQVQDVGDPYGHFYLSSYTMPNMHVHATLTSAKRDDSLEERIKDRRREADFALMNGMAVLLMVIRSQNTLFSLTLESDLEACERDWVEVWAEPSA